MIKVAIIDDHSVVRMGFKYMLAFAKDMKLVGEATGGEGAAKFVADCHPDVVLLDVRMPGVDGIAALSEILAAAPQTKVVMLTTSDTEDDVYRAISLGAKGYILKETEPNTLLDAIRTVANGGTCVPDAIQRIYDVRVSEKSLTAREREILRYVAKGFSNDEIGKQLGISANTVKAHVASIIATLGAGDRAESVAIGIQRGLIAS